jgi:hypothetical protein
MKKIKFVYYDGHVCKVLNDRFLETNNLLTIEVTTTSPSYHLLVETKDIQIAGYWD